MMRSALLVATIVGYLSARGYSASEPETYVPYEIYSIDFCRDRANDWQLNGGDWKWITSGCKLRSDNSSYNMGWLGRRDPVSLDWEDYSCSLELSWTDDDSEADGSRGMVMYAQARNSEFYELNGYECAVVRSDGEDYLKMYTMTPNGNTELNSTHISITDNGVKTLEIEVYSVWKTCYLTSGNNTFSISAVDSTYSGGSVGVITETASTTFKDISCYELGTLAPSLTVMPTHAPSPLPTIADPTFKPTTHPTDDPTSAPSLSPTTGPTPYPSSLPTPSPTHAPTTGPTPYPSGVPTPVPTTGPTPYPSITPSAAPSGTPTTGPTPYPSISPTPSPSLDPSYYPTPKPSLNPSFFPTVTPSLAPTETPSSAPSAVPTAAPSRIPTPSPTLSPTTGPTPYPSASPSVRPSEGPTMEPSEAPTYVPTLTPFASPSPAPTTIPTTGPTPFPSELPTMSPTLSPTVDPSEAPSISPTIGPTPYPSAVPSPSPTHEPVVDPTADPTHSPTPDPTHAPTPVPTSSPTYSPSSTYGTKTVSAFGTADIGFAVMGVVLLVACLVCCLAGIGYNSKRKKREAQNALAWDQISESISTDGGSLSEPLDNEEEEEDQANPMQTTQEESSFESLWPSALFGSSTATAAEPVPYQAAATDDQDGMSMWPGAIKKGKKEEEEYEVDGDAGQSNPHDVAEAEVSFFDSIWPTSDGKDKNASSWYGASTETTVAPATDGGNLWSFDGDAALNGEGESLVAPVVAEAHEDDAEEFHF